MLEIKNLSYQYEGHQVLSDIHLQVAEGETVGLLGMSGVGKTTLFNLVSQGLAIQEGSITMNGSAQVSDKISYMMQKDLLFDHKTVAENIALPLHLKGLSRRKVDQRVRELLEDFQLEQWSNHYPKVLSGGMRQRIELLRTIAFDRRWVLLDEPFGALDMKTRQQMHFWFKKIRQEHHWSTLLVTHDVDEALMLCDRIYVLSGQPGKISLELPISLNEKIDYVNQNQDSLYLSYKTQLLEELMG